jgi:hypothetical protein
MIQQLETRLSELHSEYEAGQKMILELEAKQQSLRETLLRISGAIQVLEEELAKAKKQGVKTEGIVERPEDSLLPD